MTEIAGWVSPKYAHIVAEVIPIEIFSLNTHVDDSYLLF